MRVLNAPAPSGDPASRMRFPRRTPPEQRPSLAFLGVLALVFTAVACVVTGVVTRAIVRGNQEAAAPSAAAPSAAAPANAPDPYAYLSADEKDTAILAVFRAWKGKYKKVYSSVAAEDERFKLYLKTLERLQAHVSKRSQVGANHLADYTAAEIAALKGFKKMLPPALARRSTLASPPTPAPACPYPFTCYGAKDWTAVEVGGASAVSVVKDQQQCGSCWAHATTAALESNIAIKYNQSVVSLSREALAACLNNVKVQGQQPWSGCNGGDIWWATEYGGSTIGGVVPDASYPYVSGNDNGTTGMPGQSAAPVTEPCTVSLGSMAASGSYPYGTARWAGATPYGITGEDVLLALLQNGPVAVSIDASSPSFQSYTGGVFDTPCAAGAPNEANNDHALVVVGYGVDPTTKLTFWKLKNSWGPMWGEEGFMRIQAFYYWPNKSGLCGVGFTPVQPTFGTGMPPPRPPLPPPLPPSPSPPPAPVPELCSSPSVHAVSITGCSATFEEQCGVFKITPRSCSGVPVFALATLPPPPSQFSVGLSLFFSAATRGWIVATPKLECTGASFGMAMKAAGLTAANAMAGLSTAQFPTGTVVCLPA